MSQSIQSVLLKVRELSFPGASFLALFLVFCILPAPGKSGSKTAQPKSLSGYLIDLTCARERVEEGTELGPKHTRKCLQMPACDRSGFGILTADNHLVRFDAQGNMKARKVIGGTKKTSGIRVRVTGEINNDV